MTAVGARHLEYVLDKPTMPQYFRDDLEIDDHVVVYRRAHWDKIGGRARATPGVEAKISPNFFSDYPEDAARKLGYEGPCMSVGLGSVLEELGLDPSVMLAGYDDREYGLTRTRVGDLRQLKRASGESCPQGIMASPTKAEPWHGVVFDLNYRPRKDPVRKAIARVSTWQIPLIVVDE